MVNAPLVRPESYSYSINTTHKNYNKDSADCNYLVPLAKPLSLNDKPLLLSTEELEKSVEYSLVSIEPLLLSGKGKLLSNKAISVSAKH